MSKNKKNKKKAPPEVFYATIGESISPGIAYLQAASLLDMAAVTAVEFGDTEGMTSVAHQWMEMAVLMQGPHEQDTDAVSDTRILGFGSNSAREVAEKNAKQSREG